MPLTTPLSIVRPARVTLPAVAVAVALGLSMLLATPARAAVQDNLKIPLAGLVFDDEEFCGEGFVHTAGFLHILVTQTENANRVTTTVHFQPQGAKLVGLVSGDAYVGTGVTREAVSESTDGSSSTFTFVNNFRIIGKGSTPNFTAHTVMHVTVNANGETTADFERTTIVCR